MRYFVIGVGSDAGAESERRAYVVDSIASKGRAVRLESTLFPVGDNLASSHWSEWRGQVHNRRKEGWVQDRKW